MLEVVRVPSFSGVEDDLWCSTTPGRAEEVAANMGAGAMGAEISS